MNIENFRIYNDLVANQSFSKAGKLNGITQSAVSQQLRNMEKSLGSLILDRNYKDFQLTREGKYIHEVSISLVQQYDRLVGTLQEMRNEVAGSIRLSAIYSIGLHVLPTYLTLFMKEFPQVNIQIEYRRANSVYEDILNNSADMGLVAYPQNRKGIETIPFEQEELVFVAGTDHPLTKKEEVSLSDLEKSDFVGFDISIPTRGAIDEFFKSLNLSIEPVMEFDNIETVKRAVEINSGIAMLPRPTINQELARNTLVVLPVKTSQSIYRPTALILKENHFICPALKALMKTLNSSKID